MKYVSIDIETTGLDPERDQMLEFAAVLEDWNFKSRDKLPHFHRYILHPRIEGSPYALSMHSTILRRIATKDPAYMYCTPGGLGSQFAAWLVDAGLDPKHVCAAGKNFASFDLQFLLRLDNFRDKINFKHRSLDPAQFYWRPKDGEWLPGTEECCERAGIIHDGSHTALADALQVIHLIRIAVRRQQNETTNSK